MLFLQSLRPTQINSTPPILSQATTSIRAYPVTDLLHCVLLLSIHKLHRGKGFGITRRGEEVHLAKMQVSENKLH